MLKKTMNEALNGQMAKEYESAYLYLSMSAACEAMALKGAAQWFRVQYKEEIEHFERLYKYVFDQGGTVRLAAIAQPPAEFASLKDMFEQTLKHEQFITRSINELVDLAVKEKDHATAIMLQWFVTEQVEEEGNDRDILDRLGMIGDKGHGLFMLDRDLGKRKDD